MEWIWGLYENFVRKQLAAEGKENPTDDELQRTFMEILSDSTVTVLVQEPWQNSVRFKALARYEWGTMSGLIGDPMQYLLEQFGGGKFKLNFHRGWNFVATQNFKPQGEPKWKNLPEIDV
jgi:hypothetical protein